MKQDPVQGRAYFAKQYVRTASVSWFRSDWIAWKADTQMVTLISSNVALSWWIVWWGVIDAPHRQVTSLPPTMCTRLSIINSVKRQMLPVSVCCYPKHILLYGYFKWNICLKFKCRYIDLWLSIRWEHRPTYIYVIMLNHTPLD